MTIGERPLGAGDSITGHFEAELADVTLDEALTEVLSHGYQFNTDEDYPLMPDNTGVIEIPSLAIAVDASQSSSDYIVRDGKLYDKTTQKDNTFTDAISVDILWNIPFDELHPIVQSLVVATAKTKLYTRVVGVDNMYAILKEEEEAAKTALLHEELQSGDYSIFDDTYVVRPMRRSQNPTAL